MIHNEILKSIENVSDAENEVSFDVSMCVLEYYGKITTIVECCNDSMSFDDVFIFQEAGDTNLEDKKQSVGSKIMDILRQIINAIRNACSTIFNKITKGVSDTGNEINNAVRNCKKKVTRKNSEGLFASLNKFRKKHPLIFTIGAVTATSGAIYGGSKALDAAGKSHAMKELLKEDREIISKCFDTTTETITIPYKIANISAVVRIGYEGYKSLYTGLVSDLGLSGDERPSTEKCDAYFKTDKFSKVIDKLNDIETNMTQRDYLTGFDGSTSITGGVDGWNKAMKDFGSDVEDAEQCSALIMTFSGILYEAIAGISDKTKREECAKLYASKVESYVKRHTQAMYDINIISTKLSDLVAVLAKFFPRYYAVSNKIAAVKSEILECLENGAKLVSIALNKPTTNEQRELSEIMEKKREVEKEYDAITNEINILGINKGKLIDDINELKEKKEKLEKILSNKSSDNKSDTESKKEDDTDGSED